MAREFYGKDWSPVSALTTSHGPITTVPYTVEVNDVAVFALQHFASDEFLKRGSDQFDRL